MNRHVLIVAYNMPPHGAVGTLRTLRLVEHLATTGWRTTVLTPTPTTYQPGDPIDTTLESRWPPAVRVRRVPVLRPVAGLAARLRARRSANETPGLTSDRVPADAFRPLWRRVLQAIGTLTSIPDQEAGWIGPAVGAGLWHALRDRPDIIYSTAPPWTAQVIAYALACALRCPWVADFRDPWARGPWRTNQHPWTRRAWCHWERRVVSRADAVVFNTHRLREEFASYYGDDVARKLHVVMNGCDVAALQALPPPPADGQVMLHAGSIYGGRDPVPLFRAMAALVRTGDLDPCRFRLRLLGVPSLSTDVSGAAEALGVSRMVEVLPRTTRAEALAHIGAASALLLLQPGHPLSVPAKAYEYLEAGRPILAITDEGATADLIRSSGAGVVASADNPREVAAALRQVLAMTGPGFRGSRRGQYDGARCAAELEQILEVTRRSHAPGRALMIRPVRKDDGGA